MNTNVDLILSGTDLLKSFAIGSINPKNCQKINDLKEFKECFKYFFQKGSAAERSFLSQQDFDQIIQATANISEKKVRFYC